MRLKQVFIPLRISKGLLCLIAMFVMLLAPQVAWATVFPTSTLTAVQDDDVKYTWTVEGMGAFNVSGDVTSPTSGGLEVGVNGCTINGLEGDSSAPSDYEHFLYKVKIAGIDDNSSITVKIINGSDNFYFIASTTAGEFYMPNSVRWDSGSELFIEVKDACTITGVEVFRSTKSLNGSFGWSGDPKDNNNAISGAKLNDGSIKINALEHQSYSYPFANEGVTYGSTNTSVAAVGTDGTVTIKKIGSTMITATVRNYVEDIVNEDITFGYTLTVDFPAPTIIPNGGHQLSATEIALSYEATNMPDLKYKWGDGEEKSYSAPFAVQTGTLTAWAELVPSGNQTAIKSYEATATFTAVGGTSYGLTVAGIPVTSENCDNVLGDNEDVHKVTYDPESKTLTLNNVTMEGNVVRTNSDNLIVNFVGTSRFRMVEADQDYAFVGNGGVLTLTTTGSVVNPLLVDNTWKSSIMNGWDTENSTEVASSNIGSPEWWVNTSTGTSDQIALMKKPVSYNLTVAGVEVTSANASDVFDDGKVSYNATTKTLTLNNFTFNSGGQEKYGVKYTGTTSNFTIKLIGTNSITTGNGCEPIIFDAYQPQTIPTLTFEKGSFPCSLTLNGGNGTVIKYFDGVEGVNGLGSTTTRDLYLLADAEAQYNASTGLTTSSGAVSKATITSGYGLTVAGALVHDGNKDNVLGTPEGSTPTVSFTPAVAAEGDDPATPATLTLNGATIVGDIETSLDNLTISVSDANTLIGSIKYIGTNNSTATLTIDANLDDVNTASLELSSKEIGVISGFNTVTVNSPLETTVTDWTSDVKNATLAAESYDISIAGVLVTNANKDNVLGTPEGTTPTVSFTPATDNDPAILTLNGATIGGGSDLEPMEECGIDYTGAADLTISLKGTNTITGTGGCEAIRCDAYELETTPKLKFTKADNNACSLQLTAEEGETVIKGFSAVQGVNGIGDAKGNFLALSNASASYSATNGLYTGEDTPVTSATIISGYDICVEGVLVHEGNKDNVLGDQEETHKVTFTPAVDEPAMPATLTLNEVNYSLNDGDKTPLVISGLDNLTVKLVGSSSVYTSDQAEVYPDAAFVSTNSEAVLTFTTDESTNLQPLNTNTIELASGFKSIAFTGYLYREQNMVKNLLAPTPSIDGDYFVVSRAGYEPEGTTFNYEIDYVDEELEDATGTYDPSKTAEENGITLSGPCTVTVYAQYETVKSAEKEGRLLGFEQSEISSLPGSWVDIPAIVPTIINTDGIEFGHEGVNVNETLTKIDLTEETYGKTILYLYFDAGENTPYSLLNSSAELIVNVIPPAPTIEFDTEKTYLNSDKVSISLPEALKDDTNASIKYSWVADCEPGNGNNYNNESKVELNAGTHTLYAWVRYNGATADDAVYSERVSQKFTAKTDINQFAVKDMIENEEIVYTGSPIVPTFTLYDEKVQTNVLSADNYDVRIEKFVDETTGYSVVESIVDAGLYMVYAVGKGTTYGGEKLIYERFEVEQANLPLTVSDVENLTYTGSDQSLVTESDVPEGVTVKYYCQYFTFEQYGEGSSELSCDPDAVNFEYTAGVPKGKNAGVYGILYLVDGGDNYKSKTEATQTIWVTIDAATITSVTLSKTEYTFDTTAQTPTIASVKAGDDLTLTTDDYTVSYEKINGDETTTAISASDVKAVGSYNVVVTGTGNFKGTAKAAFAIVNRTLADGEVTFHKNWATFYNAVGDVDLPEGIGAFIVLESGIGENTVTVTPINYIPEGEAVLLSNDANVVTQTDNTSVEGNMLRHTNKNIDIYNSTNYYGLYNGTFMRVSGTISAESNYLLMDMPQAPQLTIVFENEATGINDVRSKKADVRGDFYDLQGRKVEKPSKKGLYINEGHKVVVK